ncbi:MAG: hypothetical protein K2I22_06500 [Lachnospiraceae bacterium]|nr:hypothetical protein [Lachnospiraceae bacterium]
MRCFDMVFKVVEWAVTSTKIDKKLHLKLLFITSDACTVKRWYNRTIMIASC